MKTAFIIHGAYGNNQENWFPWLKSEIEKLNYSVFVPNFPTPKNQNLENWLNIFEEYKKYLSEDSIMIGHSIGVAFILNILENIDLKINACFSVSGFTDLLDNPEFDKINKTFINKKFDFEKIKNNCKKFFIYHSDNDPYVSIDKAEIIAKNLNEKIILVKNAGHFNSKSGYNKFELLIEKIKEL
ncbi:MAG: alpha/beta hydrolase [Patescibacteria group bacterium]|nr:alpha/beta hydrolase [Patescibacteria group bacterium]